MHEYYDIRVLHLIWFTPV